MVRTESQIEMRDRERVGKSQERGTAGDEEKDKEEKQETELCFSDR